MRCQAVLEALRGRFDVARSMLDSSRATLEELGLRHGLLETAYLTGVVELVAGDPAAAIAPLRDAYDGLIEMGVGIDAGRAAALLAHALVAEGRVDDAEPMAGRQRGARRPGPQDRDRVARRAGRGARRARRCQPAGSRSRTRRSRSRPRPTSSSTTPTPASRSPRCTQQAGDAAAARSARAEAKRLYDLKGATVPAERLADAPAPEQAPPVAPTPAPTAAGSGTGPKPNPADTRTPDPLNAAALVTFEVGARLGRWTEIPDRFSPEATVHDRRRLVGGQRRSGRAEVLAMDQAFGAVGFDTPNEHAHVLAVRGDRLALVSGGTTTSDGLEAQFVTLVEIDELRRIAALDFYDEDALADALAELDARYLDGEGAPFSSTLAPANEFARRHQRREWDELPVLFAEDFVLVDHRTVGVPEVHRDGVVELYRGMVDLVPNLFVLQQTQYTSGYAVLSATLATGTTPEGNDYEWQLWTVGDRRAHRAHRTSRVFLGGRPARRTRPLRRVRFRGTRRSPPPPGGEPRHTCADAGSSNSFG